MTAAEPPQYPGPAYLPDEPPPAQRTRHVGRWGLIGVGTPALAALAAACASAPTTPAAPLTFDLRGTVTVKTTNYDGHCPGTSPFTDDVHQGTQVTVYDVSGKVLAAGQLGTGSDPAPNAYVGSCVYPITVKGVPDQPGMYQVEVAHQGKAAVSPDTAKAGTVSLNLG
jgi:hypothetical protein